jgi:hypothetical protein
MGKSMVKEYITGLMALSTQVSGSKMRCMVQENSFGLMGVSTKDSSI